MVYVETLQSTARPLARAVAAKAAVEEVAAGIPVIVEVAEVEAAAAGIHVIVEVVEVATGMILVTVAVDDAKHAWTSLSSFDERGQLTIVLFALIDEWLVR